MNFIKDIAQNKVNKNTHHAFVRYGPGEFEKENFIAKKVGKNLKIWAGFEYSGVLLKFVASLCKDEVNLNGVIPCMREIGPVLDKYKIEYEAKRRYMGKKGSNYTFNTTLSASNAQKLIDELFDTYLLVDLVSGPYKVKFKKKETPKIGKAVEKFISVSVPCDHVKEFVDEFLFDAKVDDFKEVLIKHVYKVEDVILDDKIVKQDPAKARIEAKRKGIIFRTITVDGNEKKKEYGFLV